MRDKMREKVEQNIAVGLWFPVTESKYSVAVGQVYDGCGQKYYVAHYEEGLPSFNTRYFGTIKELVTAMREVEPDPCKWRVVRWGLGPTRSPDQILARRGSHTAG